MMDIPQPGHPTSSTCGDAASASSLAPFRALVIEDDEITSRLLELTLSRRCGATGRTADCATDAIAQINGPHAFDIVFVDVGLPDANGLDELRHSHLAHPEAHHIVVTSRDDEETLVAAAAAGADDYLLKPVRFMTLLLALEHALTVDTFPDDEITRPEAAV